MTRRRRPGFTRGPRRWGAAAFAASFGRKPYGAASCRARHPGDRPPAVPAASPLPRPPAPRPGRRRRAECAGRRENVTASGPERRALSGSAPPPARAPEDPSNRSAQTAPQKASSGPTLACGASADPAGLTARARPKARPEAHAASLRSACSRTGDSDARSGACRRRSPHGLHTVSTRVHSGVSGMRSWRDTLRGLLEPLVEVEHDRGLCPMSLGRLLVAVRSVSCLPGCGLWSRPRTLRTRCSARSWRPGGSSTAGWR